MKTEKTSRDMGEPVKRKEKKGKKSAAFCDTTQAVADFSNILLN